MRIQYPLTALLLAAIAAASANASDESNWNNLGTLQARQRIGIVQIDRSRQEGVFAGFSDAGISILTDRVITVPKENVARVYRRPRMGRLLRAAVGAAIGLAGGALLNGTIGQYLRNEAHGAAAGVWIGAGAGVGAGIGAATGGGERTVYRRDVAIPLQPAHLAIIVDIAKHEVSPRTTPGGTFGPPGTCPDTLDGGRVDRIFRKSLVPAR